jgi:hypothetical protein
MSSQFHRVTSAVRRRRSALGLLAGLAAAAAIVVPTLATGTTPPAGKTPPAGQTAQQDNSCTGPPDPVFTSAVAQLERAGTIDSTQAQAIDAQMQGCATDLQQLVDSGIITAAQAQAVNDALVHAKMSLAQGADRHDHHK